MLHRRLDNSQLKLTPFEHRVLRVLKQTGIVGRPLLVAVSGGVDSVALLHALVRTNVILKNKIAMAFIHHGSGLKSQVLYRNRARKKVSELAKKYQLEFLTNQQGPKQRLKSEEDLREFRYQELAKLSQQFAQGAYLVLAHHRDDQLETQIMRLVRGTGLHGLKAMQVLSDERLRPLLEFSRDEICDYAKEFSLKFVDDPSNKSRDPLRNWMRHTWLMNLEKKIPGAKASLARSLALILTETSSYQNKKIISGSSLDRTLFLALSRDQKTTVVASYLRKLNIRSYTRGHIEEICRQLDNSRNEFKFTLLKHEWFVNAERILAKKCN